MELLNSHRSIRKYNGIDISDDVLNDILYSGIRSSNTGNMQLYSIVVTRDAVMKNELAPLHFNQAMVKDAPVLLTICIDINRFGLWCSLNNTSADFNNLLWLLNGTIDASILAQNICIAAEGEGLGICYLGTTLYSAPEIIGVLQLPAGVIPITAITLGYPELIPELTDRLPLQAVVHSEIYRNYTKEEIFALYFGKDNLESSRRFVAENNKENLAQVYTEVRYKSQDSLFFSEKLRKLLMDQGFL